MIDDIRCEHCVKSSKVSAGNRLGKFSESREIFVLSHSHSSFAVDRFGRNRFENGPAELMGLRHGGALILFLRFYRDLWKAPKRQFFNA